MGFFTRMLSTFLAWLSGLFLVTRDHINKDKRGNLPPPGGGPSA